MHGLSSKSSTFEKIIANLQFGFSVRRFVRERLTLDEATHIVRRRLAQRKDMLLSVLRMGVFENPRSAYWKLFANAGLTLRHVEKLIESYGVEGGLEELKSLGVFVTYEEFKSITTGKEYDVDKFGTDVNFLNPLSGPGMSVRSSGTRSRGTRLFMDFRSLREVAVQRLLRSAEFGLLGAERGGYLPIPPAPSGLKLLVIGQHIGERQTAWFTPVNPRRSPLVYRLATEYALGCVKLARGHIVRPQYVSLDDPEPALRWIAERRAQGKPCGFHAYATTNVRVCQAAKSHGMDVSGTGFLMLGEPVTESKRNTILEVGGIPMVAYSSVDAGVMGNSCRFSESSDDMHFFTDSFALLRHQRNVPGFDVEVTPFLITSLLPGTPLILINVELDDYGIVSERPCDCIWGKLGMNLHISRVRSFVKLTAEGMTFAGTNLIDVIENDLPAQFGGTVANYQLIEEEDGEGRSRLSLRVSPSIGDFDERAAVDLLHRRVASEGGAGRFSSEFWREAGALRIERTDPVATASGKVLPFNTLR